MMPDNDERMDELLRSAARDYNAPGEVPRDRIWQRVQAAREAAQRESGRAPAPGISRLHRRWHWAIGSVAAAALVLGMAIGRLYERRSTGTRPQLAAASPTVSPASVDSQAPTGASFPAVASAPPAASLSRGGDSPRERTPHADGSSGTVDEAAPPDAAYRLAVAEHLVGTEAMLTSFRAAARNGDVDAQLTRWARNLLTTTRLLESSPAAPDPAMRRLLADLELVLLQIAHYSNTEPDHAQELDLIEHSIERRGVISKLRTTIPTGQQPAGT